MVKFIVDKYTDMRKLSALFVSASILFGFGLFFTACDDDEPPVKPKLSFGVSTLTTKESDANLIIEIVLDKAASEDITIDYSLGGTAIDEITAGTTADPDYEVISDYLEVEIEKGETTGTIELDLYTDGIIEDDENIEISIEDVDSDQIEITRDDEINITLKQEDGMVVVLEWPAPTADKSADMDIILRVGQNTTTWDGVLNVAIEESFQGPEILFIPKAVSFPAFGLSYVYYDGTLDPLEFTATFIDYTNQTPEPVASRESFDVTYTALNKNKWTDISTTIVVQTMLKTGEVFSTPSAVVVPAAGSRVSSSSDNFVLQLNKTSSRGNWSKEFHKLLKK